MVGVKRVKGKEEQVKGQDVYRGRGGGGGGRQG